MRYWCISTSRRNWEVCRKNRLWGMDGRYLPTLEEFVGRGDGAVAYVKGGHFVAVVEFTGEHFFDKTDLGWTKGTAPFLFPYRIPFRIVHESSDPAHIKFSVVEVDDKCEKVEPNFIDDISFITDKGRTWNQFLQVSLIRLTKEDFETISAAIRRSPS